MLTVIREWRSNFYQSSARAGPWEISRIPFVPIREFGPGRISVTHHRLSALHSAPEDERSREEDRGASHVPRQCPSRTTPRPPPRACRALPAPFPRVDSSRILPLPPRTNVTRQGEAAKASGLLGNIAKVLPWKITGPASGAEWKEVPIGATEYRVTAPA